MLNNAKPQDNERIRGENTGSPAEAGWASGPRHGAQAVRQPNLIEKSRHGESIFPWARDISG